MKSGDQIHIDGDFEKVSLGDDGQFGIDGTRMSFMGFATVLNYVDYPYGGYNVFVEHLNEDDEERYFILYVPEGAYTK